jgi:hypothetical protein
MPKFTPVISLPQATAAPINTAYRNYAASVHRRPNTNQPTKVGFSPHFSQIQKPESAKETFRPPPEREISKDEALLHFPLPGICLLRQQSTQYSKGKALYWKESMKAIFHSGGSSRNHATSLAYIHSSKASEASQARRLMPASMTQVQIHGISRRSLNKTCVLMT